MIRTTSTLDVLKALHESGRISFEDVPTLEGAWSLASGIRAGNVLTSGHMSRAKLDILLRDLYDLKPLARALGYRAGYEGDAEKDRMYCARRAQKVMGRLL